MSQSKGLGITTKQKHSLQMRLIRHKLIYVPMSVNSDIQEGQTDRRNGTPAIFEFVVSETHLKYMFRFHQFSTFVPSNRRDL